MMPCGSQRGGRSQANQSSGQSAHGGHGRSRPYGTRKWQRAPAAPALLGEDLSALIYQCLIVSNYCPDVNVIWAVVRDK